MYPCPYKYTEAVRNHVFTVLESDLHARSEPMYSIFVLTACNFHKP